MPGSCPLSSFAACSPATKSSKSEKRPSHLCRQHGGEYHHGYGKEPRLGWDWSGVHGVGVGRGWGRGTAGLVPAEPQSYKGTQHGPTHAPTLFPGPRWPPYHRADTTRCSHSL